jgi:hypothetical protein
MTARMSNGSIGLLYLERFSESDLALLSQAAGQPGRSSERSSRLRADPASIPALLERPASFQALFGARAVPGFVFASPHLAFSVLITRVWQELGDVRFVKEWVAPRRSVPLFDHMALRSFAEDAMRRLFLVDVLSSYTRVVSGPVWVRSGRRWSRRRFSELDPLHLIRLIEATPDREHPALYRRLGDLSLFLAGVFPDHAATRLFGGKLARLKGVMGTEWVAGGVADSDSIELLERLGRRSYRMVSRQARTAQSGMALVLEDVAEGFSQARRVLNFLTERHLFPLRDAWFGPGPA